MNSDIRNNRLNWFSPFNKWEPRKPGDKDDIYVEESINITPKEYKLTYIFSEDQQVDVETKIEGQFFLLKLYKKSAHESKGLETEENVLQLFYCNKFIVLPDMLTDKIATSIKPYKVVVEIPRKIRNKLYTNEPNQVNSFKESYYG